MKTGLAVLAVVFALAVGMAGAELIPAEGPQRVGPESWYLPFLDRYYARVPSAQWMPVPRERITRATYMKWIEDSGRLEYYGRGWREGDSGRWAVSSYLPVLAKWVETGDRELGELCVLALQKYYGWLQQEVEAHGRHSMFLDVSLYLGLYREYLSAGGLLDPEEEWFRDLVVLHNRTLHPWGTPEHYWRGPVHRSVSEATGKRLAALWYPDIPEAEYWREYAEQVRGDWWPYRDLGYNDSGYFFSVLKMVALDAYLRGVDEVFTDPGMQPLWERVLHEISAEGAAPAYGSSGGWNASADQRIWLLELLATKTRDGRYRWAAHRLMNYLLYQQERYMAYWTLQNPECQALAYLFADDSLQPQPVEEGSRILYRKELLYLRFNKDIVAKYLGPLDPDPLKHHASSPMVLTERVLPSKLVLRSGWEPGDLYALVELYPRLRPVNTGGILALMRWGAVLGMSISTKGQSQEGRLVLQDRGGTAALRHNTNADIDEAFMPEVEVPVLRDLAGATFATIVVQDYEGFPVRYTRELAFIKNRFLVSRERVRFEESFLALAAPSFNTQNVGPQAGKHWANTFISEPRSAHSGHGGVQALKHPPYDLLVYFAPRADCTLQVVDRAAQDPFARDMPYQVRYEWQGLAEAGQEQHFTQVLYPHPPSLQRGGVPEEGRSPTAEELTATAGAAGIRVLRDTPEVTVLRLELEPGRVEWVVCNPGGARVEEGDLVTDAEFLYLDTQDGEVRSVSAAQATVVSWQGQELARTAERAEVG